MGFHLHIENFRCLREVDLDLEGVCVLVGPNGSGKSTLLKALQFMSDALLRGPTTAVEGAGGGGTLQNLSSNKDIVLRASRGDLVWEILPKPLAAGVQLPMEERFRKADRTLVEQASNSASFTINGKVVSSAPQGFQGFKADARLGEERSLFLQMVDSDPAIARLFYPLTESVGFHISVYEPDFRRIRSSGSQLSTDAELSSDGTNIFSVLRNWKAGDRKHEERFVFVREGLRKAFPGIFEEIDFVTAGQIVTARFYEPSSTKPIDFHLAPTGVIAGLLHLAAVASITPRGSVSIDEFENSLHPHAIKVLIDHIRERAAKLNLTVILTSHSPVVLDQFRDCPNQAVVMDPAGKPTPLDQLENREWLAQFSLGELYANENIGAVKTTP